MNTKILEFYYALGQDSVEYIHGSGRDKANIIL
jgi:hypothetical protein